MLNQTGPCDWPIASPSTDSDCAPCSTLEDMDEAERALVERMAVDLLWAWSGRKFGTCSVTVRPCREVCSDRVPTFWGKSGTFGGMIPQTGGWSPALIAGQWYNIRCGACPPSRCSCSPDKARSIELPGPVASIESITIEGAVLPPESYTLRDGVLYRIDGGSWPMCNNETGDVLDPESGAWEITYSQGYPVPAGGQIAAYILACEIAKSRCGDSTCQLPRRIQTVTRQGVTVGVLDSFEGLEDGRTGIWEIDSGLASVSFKPTSPPQVFSPDIPAGTGRGTLGGIGFGGYR